MNLKGILCGGLLTLALAVPASADPIGNLTMDAGKQSVTVSLTTIDWGPSGLGHGDFVVGGATTLTSAAGNPQPGDAGTILDLPPVPVDDFLTFTLYPGLTFDLDTIGPGSSNTNCASVTTPSSSPCSPYVGSPFVLSYAGPNATTVTLFGTGTASDGVGDSFWSGLFTAQFSDMSPLAIQQAFGCTTGSLVTECTNRNATLTNTYSASLTAVLTPVPEPVSLTLLGSGLLGIGLRARRRR